METSTKPFDIRDPLISIALLICPIGLFINLLVNLIVPYLQWSPKPKKLVFYILSILPETTAFLCYCLFFFPDTFLNVVQGNKVMKLTNLSFTCNFIVASVFSYKILYLVELIRFGDEMQTMLKVHHLAAIIFGFGAGWTSISTTNVFLAQYIMWTGALGAIHAVVDCVPHIYLTLRQFKAPARLTNFFGFLSAWPLTLFRLGNNILYVFVVRYFCLHVLDEFSPLFYFWTVFSAVIFLVLAVTQVWAHRIYVAIMKKERKGERVEKAEMGILMAQ